MADAALFSQYAALPRHSCTLSLLVCCRLSTPIERRPTPEISQCGVVTEAAQLGGVTQTTRPNSSASQKQGMRGVEI